MRSLSWSLILVLFFELIHPKPAQAWFWALARIGRAVAMNTGRRAVIRMLAREATENVAQDVLIGFLMNGGKSGSPGSAVLRPRASFSDRVDLSDADFVPLSRRPHEPDHEIRWLSSSSPVELIDGRRYRSPFFLEKPAGL